MIKILPFLMMFCHFVQNNVLRPCIPKQRLGMRRVLFLCFGLGMPAFSMLSRLRTMTSTIVKMVCLFVAFSLSNATFAEWKLVEYEDEMTGQKYINVSSNLVKPTRILPFPYENLRSKLVYFCSIYNEEVSVFFSQPPNLVNSRIEGNYRIGQTWIKWDDEISEIGIRQKLGDQYLTFELPKSKFWEVKKIAEEENKKTYEILSEMSHKLEADNLKNIVDKSSMLLELEWYRLGNVYFRYSLAGSKEKIEKAKTMCGLESE